MTKQKFQSTSACRLIRVLNSMQIICEPISLPSILDFHPLASLYPICDTASSYLISSEPEISESLWVVVKSLTDLNGCKGHVLSSGDCIKLGRVMFNVVELKYTDEEEGIHEFVMQEETEKEKLACRICMCDIEKEDDPLVSPCMCSGTMKFIHMQCLQRWVSTNRTIKNTDCTASYSFKIHNCEVCKQPFKRQIHYGNRTFDLFNIWRPTAPYIMLQSQAKDTRGSQSFHIIGGADALAKLGRGHDCNIRIPDISVSRFHAVIKHVGNRFILEDNSSKFGTLLKMHEPLKLEPYNQVSLQVGRTLLNLEVKYRLNDDRVDIPVDFSDGFNTSDDDEIQVREMHKG